MGVGDSDGNLCLIGFLYLESLGYNLAEFPAGNGLLVKHTRIIVTHYGGPDAIQVIEEECPEPKDGEVRVKVLAAGVSLPDIMAREGFIPRRPWYPSHLDGIWLAWWIGSAMESRESNQARLLPRCRSAGPMRSSSACRNAN